jgi:hypothetical protein
MSSSKEKLIEAQYYSYWFDKHKKFPSFNDIFEGLKSFSFSQ